MTDQEIRERIAAFQQAIRLEPLEVANRFVLADFLDEYGPQLGYNGTAAKSLREGRVVLSSLDVDAIRALGKCRFAPGSFPKKFARDLNKDVLKGLILLSPKQYRVLWDFCYTYRLQILDIRINAEAASVHAFRIGKPLARPKTPEPDLFPNKAT